MKQQGFTLVELLLALAIFAVMSAMAYSGLTAALKSRETINAALDRTQALQSAIFRIQTDLEQTAARSIRDEFGDTQPALLGSADNGITFTRNGWRNPLEERRSYLQRVGYRLDEENTLVRLHWRVLDRAQDSAPIETPLIENVTSLEWRYLDENDEWVDRWPPANFGRQSNANSGTNSGTNAGANSETKLPRAVELRMETKTLGDTRNLFYIAQPSR